MKRISLNFKRESINNSELSKIDYKTKGIYETKDNFNILTYKDVEISKDVQLIWSNTANEVLVISDNKLKFTLGKDNICVYKTEHGSIVVKTKTHYIKWDETSLILSYSLTNNENNIGSYVIKISLEDNLIKE